MTKKIVVPIEGATNVTLFDEHYDVVNGKIEVPNSVAKKVLAEPNLQEAAGHGRRWLVEEIEEAEKAILEKAPVPGTVVKESAKTK